MTIKVEDNKKVKQNYVSSQIMECVDFWNREGKLIYDKNKTGELGSGITNDLANSTTYDDFVLEMLLSDSKTFVNSGWADRSGIKFECGRTRSHVWIHENDDRVLMLFVGN